MDGDATNEGWDHFPFPNFSILLFMCSCETSSISAWVSFQLYYFKTRQGWSGFPGYGPALAIFISNQKQRWQKCCALKYEDPTKNWDLFTGKRPVGICNRVMFECSPKAGACTWRPRARWPCRELRETAWVWGASTRQALQTPES